MTSRRPPRVARWLLTRFVPDDSQAAVLGDLEELFQARARSRGATDASLWYGLQAVSFSFRFAVERILESTGGLSMSAAPSWLDVKLGARMLVKTPLLTVTGCVAIATAIGINAAGYEFMRAMLATQTDTDERIVQISNLDVENGAPERRLMEDLVRWRGGLETVEQIGAVLNLDMSLVGPAGRSVGVRVAEMSASGLRVARMVPALGRPFLDTDDGPEAEPVMVLSHNAWQRYFAADPDIIGSSVRLGETAYRVVGVAPAEFRFPSAYDVWVNFRRDPEAYPARAGPPILAFGRLAPGRTLAEAEREIEQLGVLAAADYPETHGQLVPSVRPIGGAVGFGGGQLSWAVRLARTVLAMLLFVACANVATLVFARNAGRESEIAIRNALGAGRSRIVMQLFTEAMVLALVSAGVGLIVANWGLKWGMELLWEVQRADPPLWWEPGMSLSTVLYSLGLATLGAGIVGILPALRATGRGAHQQLQRLGSGGSTLAFGRLPTAVIVVQIAIAVALLPIVLTGTINDFRQRFISVSFPTERYITARLLVDSEVQLASTAADEEAGASGATIAVAGVSDRFRTGPALLVRYREMSDNVVERLRREPGVRSAALSSRLPGLLGQSIPAASLEVDGQPPRSRGWYTRTATSDLDFFDIVGRSVVGGRGFTIADYGPNQRVAVVNQAFVADIFLGLSPVGHLVRDFRLKGDNSRPWTEIVGVLPDDAGGPAASEPLIYYPRSGLGEYPMRIVIEVDGDPADFAPKLRAAIGGSEPGLILDEVLTLDEIRRSELLGELFGVLVLGFVALVTALLATAGVYSLMSFIVSQRTREIGIRTALGADPAGVVRGVFMRTFVQLGFGVVIGLVIVASVSSNLLMSDGGRTLWLTGGGVSVVLVAVGLIGCAIPLLRALRIQPMEALRADG